MGRGAEDKSYEEREVLAACVPRGNSLLGSTLPTTILTSTKKRNISSVTQVIPRKNGTPPLIEV